VLVTGAPHAVAFRDANGVERVDAMRLARNAHIVEIGGVLVRLGADLSGPALVRLAEGLRPVLGWAPCFPSGVFPSDLVARRWAPPLTQEPGERPGGGGLPAVPAGHDVESAGRGRLVATLEGLPSRARVRADHRPEPGDGTEVRRGRRTDARRRDPRDANAPELGDDREAGRCRPAGSS
jgi:hypothetical protein